VRGKRFRDQRPSLIVCDDLQNDGHMRSRLQRENSAAWFQGTLLKAGNKRTNIVNLATAVHRDALAMQLHRTPGWTSRIFRAIERWPDNMSLWRAWEQIYCDLEQPGAAERAAQFYEAHREAMNAGVQLLWPDEEDLYTLMRMRVEGGLAAFEREKQGSPFDPDLCEWPEDYFDESIWFDEWPGELAIRVIALDPSKGADSRRGDYSALAKLGVDPRGILLVEADLARRTTVQMVADGVALCRQFQPDALGIETNQYQELLVGEFAAEFARQGFLGLAPSPVENRVNKLVRIRRLGPLLASRRLRFKTHSPGTSLLVDQLRTFPHGDHDDGPDALEMAIRLAGDLAAGLHANDGLGDWLPLDSLHES
jgi:predicted phage terminase large subunit-like protein